MSNAEHLATLTEGCVQWNAWRREQASDVIPDLSGADLTGVLADQQPPEGAECYDMRGVNFRGARMCNLDFPGVDFSRADMTAVDLHGCNLSNCRFQRTRLVAANVSSASLLEASFVDAELDFATFEESDLSRAIIARCSVKNTLFAGAELSEAVFDGTPDWLADMDELLAIIANSGAFGVYITDLQNDLAEFKSSYHAENWRCCLAMAGRVLEMALKILLENNNIDFEDNWSVGRLIGAIRESGKYLDPALGNVWNIINQNRIISVHATEQVPIPSRDNVQMVAYALLDTVRRLTTVE